MFESCLEAWKHDIKNNVWIIDYNRQSLDKCVNSKLFMKIGSLFRTTGFRVIVLKYGKLQLEAFKLPGGSLLKRWMDDCDSELYSVLCFKGGANFRSQILSDLPNEPELQSLIALFDDSQLLDLITGLGGHCMETLLECFDSIDDRSTAVIAYTVKGYKLPISGHRDVCSCFTPNYRITEGFLIQSKSSSCKPILISLLVCLFLI